MWNDKLKDFEIILASKSPRRQTLLKELNLDFHIVLKEVDESYPKEIPTKEVPAYIARKKAVPFKNHIEHNQIIITADTIVLLNNQIVGKPKDAEEAKNTLRKLSGNTHSVISGVCLTTTNKQMVETVISEVTFDKLSEETINFYIDKYQPLDKAGAYGIQEWIGYVGIKEIKGSYTNIVGLPTYTLCKMLQTV